MKFIKSLLGSISAKPIKELPSGKSLAEDENARIKSYNDARIEHLEMALRANKTEFYNLANRIRDIEKQTYDKLRTVERGICEELSVVEKDVNKELKTLKKYISYLLIKSNENTNFIGVSEGASNTTVQQLFTNKPASVLYAVANPSSFPADTTALVGNQTLCPSISDKSLYLWDGSEFDLFINGSSLKVFPMEFDSLQSLLANKAFIAVAFSGTIKALSICGTLADGVTCTATIYVNTAPVTGLTNVNIPFDPPESYTATAQNTFASGDVIGLALEPSVSGTITHLKVYIFYI